MLLFLVQLFFNVIAGFSAHLIRDQATGHMKRDWADISNYSIGVISVFPLSLLQFVVLGREINNAAIRFSVSYLLSFVSFGIGVILGHWYKPVKED